MSWRYLGDNTVKGRKQHRCCLCGQIIEKGEVHIARRGFYDDDPVTSRMHIYCESATQSWDENDWECNDTASFRIHEIEEMGVTDLSQKRNTH